MVLITRNCLECVHSRETPVSIGFLQILSHLLALVALENGTNRAEVIQLLHQINISQNFPAIWNNEVGVLTHSIDHHGAFT